MPTTTSVSTLSIWQAVPWLAAVAHPILADLVAQTTAHRYPAQATIFLEGEPTAGLYLVVEGTVKISRFSKEGREQILHLIHRGDTFNDVAALDGGPNPATAIAFTDVLVSRLTRVNLQAVAIRHPDLAWALIESLARRARHLVGLVEDLSMRNVRGRLARLLLEEAQTSGEESIRRVLTQEEMASRLGTVREVVGRALRGLASDGVIEFDRHRIVILDADRLADEAAA